jgi:4-hydroxybenzoate polyprenyltransferase
MEIVYLFLIWHVLVYPSSNAYNSTQDRDEGPIGGLENPPKVPKSLEKISLAFDVLAVLLSFAAFGYTMAILVMAYIVVSRLYSNRSIRLKKFPWLAVVIIFTFQGVWVYATTSFALQEEWSIQSSIWAVLAAGFQVAAVYPISQIFQHESDQKDGVRSLSMVLGYTGTFIFTSMIYGVGLLCYFLYWKESLEVFLILLMVQLPIFSYFLIWFSKVRKNTKHANFKHTMRFTLLSSLLMNAFFTYLIMTN